jgi:hypothetical protein
VDLEAAILFFFAYWLADSWLAVLDCGCARLHQVSKEQMRKSPNLRIGCMLRLPTSPLLAQQNFFCFPAPRLNLRGRKWL